MDMPTSDREVQSTPEAPGDGKEKDARAVTRIPAIIVGTVAVVVAALSVFYLLRPVPLLVQGEADATRLDIAARVDGRVKEIPVERGQNVPAGAVLVRIDNPETVAKRGQMGAAGGGGALVATGAAPITLMGIKRHSWIPMSSLSGKHHQSILSLAIISGVAILLNR